MKKFKINVALLSTLSFLNDMAFAMDSISEYHNQIKKQDINKCKFILQDVIESQKNQIIFLKSVNNILSSEKYDKNKKVEFLNEFHVFKFDLFSKKYTTQKSKIKNELIQGAYIDEATRIYQAYYLSRLMLQNMANSIFKTDTSSESFFLDFIKKYELFIREVNRALISITNHLFSIETQKLPLGIINLSFLKEENFLLLGIINQLEKGTSFKKENSIVNIISNDKKGLSQKLDKAFYSQKNPHVTQKDLKNIINQTSISVVAINDITCDKNYMNIVDMLFNNDYLIKDGPEWPKDELEKNKEITKIYSLLKTFTPFHFKKFLQVAFDHLSHLRSPCSTPSDYSEQIKFIEQLIVSSINDKQSKQSKPKNSINKKIENKNEFTEKLRLKNILGETLYDVFFKLFDSEESKKINWKDLMRLLLLDGWKLERTSELPHFIPPKKIRQEIGDYYITLFIPKNESLSEMALFILKNELFYLLKKIKLNLLSAKFSVLPKNIFEEILKNLEIKDALNLSMTNKEIHGKITRIQNDQAWISTSSINIYKPLSSTSKLLFMVESPSENELEKAKDYSFLETKTVDKEWQAQINSIVDCFIKKNPNEKKDKIEKFKISITKKFVQGNFFKGNLSQTSEKKNLYFLTAPLKINVMTGNFDHDYFITDGEFCAKLNSLNESMWSCKDDSKIKALKFLKVFNMRDVFNDYCLELKYSPQKDSYISSGWHYTINEEYKEAIKILQKKMKKYTLNKVKERISSALKKEKNLLFENADKESCLVLYDKSLSNKQLYESAKKFISSTNEEYKKKYEHLLNTIHEKYWNYINLHSNLKELYIDSDGYFKPSYDDSDKYFQLTYDHCENRISKPIEENEAKKLYHNLIELPESLETLVFRGVLNEEFSFEWLSRLTNLKILSLKIKHRPFTKKDCKFFPTTLKYLALDCPSETKTKSKLLSKLLKNMKNLLSLKVKNVDFEGINHINYKNNHPIFPENLKELKISHSERDLNRLFKNIMDNNKNLSYIKIKNWAEERPSSNPSLEKQSDGYTGTIEITSAALKKLLIKEISYPSSKVFYSFFIKAENLKCFHSDIESCKVCFESYNGHIKKFNFILHKKSALEEISTL